jgi:hypothetical protein
MIEIQHKTGERVTKLYRWSCSLCKKKGAWDTNLKTALDDGSKHVDQKHDKEKS